ncbi:glycosyltransferase [Streptosporangium roseum]|uniref:Glycosyl transferase, group 1 n=1 Tax=Streptosporangium roseum (strain ATCC 12428 / DSM 43021 / JCM 3005 / KCTC 9067 / NCIMB 10171 / NRRL 2505 / NI 9100) TaxID=479432 RepID=D2B1Y9_STRRD|nr:glycosyltransferase [Streptosporangium roseum]ACZ89213.1 glycosyl transferase, group 1 [Streptosporangium roseum DSM 43021]
MAVSDGSGLRRVALLIPQLMPLGGTEVQISLLARELRARNIDVKVLVLRRGGRHTESPRLKGMLEGIEVHQLGFVPVSGRPSALARNLRACISLLRLLRRLRPQVLHAFLYFGYVVGAPVARLARVPVVVAGRRSQGFFKRSRRWVLALERGATRLTDHVVANAVAIAGETRAVERVPARKLSVIYNGLPEPAFDPVEPEHVDTSLPVIVCIANLLEVKGHRFLMEAAALLSRQGRACTVVLIGEGPERGPLEAQAAALGVDVRFLGCRTDTAGFLARADVVALPSLSEGLSNAVMEAMAAGRPIVATSVGGTPELLEDRGVLVPAADSPALAEGFVRLLDDPELAASLGAAARAWARKNLDVAVMADQHVTLYQRLLEARCAG